jgi:hypothetical protein
MGGRGRTRRRIGRRGSMATNGSAARSACFDAKRGSAPHLLVPRATGGRLRSLPAGDNKRKCVRAIGEKDKRARRGRPSTTWPTGAPRAVRACGRPSAGNSSPPPSHTRPSETGGLGWVAWWGRAGGSTCCASRPPRHRAPRAPVWSRLPRTRKVDLAAGSHLSVGNTDTRRGVPGAGISQGDRRFRFPRYVQIDILSLNIYYFNIKLN